MKQHLLFRGIPVTIVTRTVGQQFGTVATAYARGERFESDVKPYGFHDAAIEQAKDRAAAWLKPLRPHRETEQ